MSFRTCSRFLDIYYAGAQVLVEEQDFYELTWTYLVRAAADNVRHVEIFFDPQTHTERGIRFTTVIDGIYRASQEGESTYGRWVSIRPKWGIRRRRLLRCMTAPVPRGF